MGTKSIENKAFYVVDAPIKHYIYRALRIFYIKFFPWRCSFHDIHFVKSWHSQKQPSRVVLKKRCSENMQQIYRRTPMPKFLCNFIEIALRHGCSLVNLLYISRTSFLRTWLLLAILTNPHFLATLFILRNVHWKTCSICTRFLSYQIIYWNILSRFVINCSPMETDILSDRSEIREGYAVKSFFQSISWNMKNFHEILLL